VAFTGLTPGTNYFHRVTPPSPLGAAPASALVDDILVGGEGLDQLNGGAGDDCLEGGEGG